MDDPNYLDYLLIGTVVVVGSVLWVAGLTWLVW